MPSPFPSRGVSEKLTIEMWRNFLSVVSQTFQK